MSIPGLSALPQVPESALPASVRTGSAKDKEAYRAALGFEQVLLGQLVKSMASTGPLSEGRLRRPGAGRALLRHASPTAASGSATSSTGPHRADFVRGHRQGARMITMLEAELLAHLDAQLASARRLLGLVLEQGKAIRARDVDGVLGKLAEVQTEMGRRGALEQDRAGAAAARRRLARRPRHRGHARAPAARSSPPAPPTRRASAPPSCAACWPRSPASTGSTAR